MAPGRGEDRAPALRSAWVMLDPQGRRVHSRGLWPPSPLLDIKDGDRLSGSKCDSRMRRRQKTHTPARNLFELSHAARRLAAPLAAVAWQACANAANNARENGFSNGLYSGCHC